MFSSNQVLSISCSDQQLGNTLEFVLRMAGYEPEQLPDQFQLCYQIAEDKSLCIGRDPHSDKSSWTPFMFHKPSFDFLRATVQTYIHEMDYRLEEDGDCSGTLGYLIEAIPESFADKTEKDGIHQPFYGYVKILPFTCLYSK